MSNMYCFQCEQAAGGKVCATMGVCGKAPSASNLQDELTVALIRLAWLMEGEEMTELAARLMMEGLFTTVTNVSFDNRAILRQIDRVNQLKGNFGTAWQNQQKEFRNVPGAFLFTTNCLIPPRADYADRVFTTAVVAYPGLVHNILGILTRDFGLRPIIAAAADHRRCG